MTRILLKISGASLKDDTNLISASKIDHLIKQIKQLSSEYSISIVIGGGNIWRGTLNSELKLNRNLADNMGMMATIINALAFANVLNNHHLNAKVFSAIKCDDICEKFNYEAVDNWLNMKNNIAIFAAGTGSSYVSTDTAAALRASQIGAKKILMGKNGVDGVFDSDPKMNNKAKHFPHLTCNDIIIKKLKVMDLTALSLCEENQIEILVFNIDAKDGIIKVLKNEIKHTIIK